METPSRKIPLSGLARRIVSDKLLDEITVTNAIEKAKSSKIPLVTYLVHNKLLDPFVLANTIAVNFGLPLFDLSSFNSSCVPKNLIREDIIKRHQVVPLYKNGNHIFVATADPTNQVALDEIKFYSGLYTHPILVPVDQLNESIQELLNAQEAKVLEQLEDTDLLSLEVTSEEESATNGVVAIEAEDAPIIRFVHKILLDAIHKGASDIHFEPYEKTFRIRMRQDGILYEVASPPVTLANRISARIKVMSRLDISERRIPQDGRFKVNFSTNRAIDFRVSTCPTVTGEKVVVRILDPTTAMIGIDSLGFEPFQKEIFLKSINQPQGMVLVTGPTGSGKTVTLYTALNLLNTPDVNISSVEDPVEIHVPGVNQVNINPKAGLSFASVLRSFLRQDPDIIMVGEMRDLETVEIGVKAAQTGHLVLSTLHTNNAADTLTRLANMGLATYNIATSISLIIAQRLVRKLCDHCKKPVKVPPEVLAQEGFDELTIQQMNIFGPKGCEHCTNGYKRRIGIFEFLPLTTSICDAILYGASSIEIAKLAHQEGMITLREAGLLKVKNGITSLDEIDRLTNE